MKNLIYCTLLFCFIIPSNAQVDFNFESIKSMKRLGVYKGDGLMNFNPDKSIESIRSFNFARNSILERSIPKLKSDLLTRQIPDGERLFNKCSPGVVLLVSSNGIGSGSIINKSGEILTNWHVTENQEKVYVCFFDPSLSDIDDIDSEKFTTATVIAEDPNRDLALLRLDNNKSKLTILKRGMEYDINISMDVFAIGHPEKLVWSFTDGSISRIRKNFKWEYGDHEMQADVIQTQTPINFGNSGGPLFNVKGELIGVNSFGYTTAQGLNFAVHLSEINDFLNEVKKGMYIYTHTVTASSKDENGYTEFDRDENGIVDAYGTSVIGTEKLDYFYLDNDEDGYPDLIVMDINEDGNTDCRIYDRDGDGEFEYFIIDNDFDQVFDTVGIDTDSDGRPDKFSEYSG